MEEAYNFKCDKCGNETYLVAENEYEKVLICEKCAECYVVERMKIRENQNIPQCPICQSTDLSKISTTKKVAKIATFGLYGAGDIGKTWKCNNCGSRF